MHADFPLASGSNVGGALQALVASERFGAKPVVHCQFCPKNFRLPKEFGLLRPI